MAPVSSKEFMDIQAAIECKLTMKLARDMIITNNQIFLYFLNAYLHNFGGKW